MTTFDERLRALVWARELLQDLVTDPSTSGERRELAARLMDGYPETTAIENRLEGLEGDALLLAGQCIEQTIGLLQTLMRDPRYPALAERARHVERHYPVQWEMIPSSRKGCRGDEYPAIRIVSDALEWAAFYLDRPPAGRGPCAATYGL